MPFEIAMKQLGGTVVVLTPNEMQIGRGGVSPIPRASIALCRCDHDADDRKRAVRTGSPRSAGHNGLTDHSHPCQLMADIMTFEEHRGNISGKRIAWCGMATICRVAGSRLRPGLN